jgi:hypothetical protein
MSIRANAPMGANTGAELVHIGPPRSWGVRGTDGPIRAAVS